MTVLADGLLIAICLTAALYCYILSKRLRQLSDTKSGLGEQILRMNERLEDTRGAVGDIRNSAKTASEKLARDIALGRKVSAELAGKLKSVDEAIERLQAAERSLSEGALRPDRFAPPMPRAAPKEPVGDEILLEDIADSVYSGAMDAEISAERVDAGEIQLGFAAEPETPTQVPPPEPPVGAKNGSKPHWSEQENLLNVERMTL